MEFCTSIRSKHKLKGLTTKNLLKNKIVDELPIEIIQGRKKGFSIPINRWFKQDFIDIQEKYLNPSTINRNGYFDYKYILDLKNEHSSGLKDNSKLIWALISFQLWHNKFIG